MVGAGGPADDGGGKLQAITQFEKALAALLKFLPERSVQELSEIKGRVRELLLDSDAEDDETNTSSMGFSPDF